MTDLFISHASEDVDRIIPLVSALENAGWSVWWDRDLIGGSNYSESIQQALDGASCVVVVWSQRAIVSSWVRDEAQDGLDRQCLVPCCMDDVRPPLGFRSIQTISMAGWPEQQAGLNKLLDGIRASLSTSTAAAEHATNSSAVDIERPDSEHSIAVLPFTNLSTDAEQQYFCDGLVEDVITDLSYVKPLVVIARDSSFAFRSNSPDVGKVARELNVKYVLLGSVRRSGSRMRVSARLVKGRSEETIWSKRYDRDVDDLFELQDDLTRHIVTALDVNLVSGEAGKKYQGYRNSDSRELIYRGMHEYRKFEPSAHAEALRYFEQFIAAEPESVEGYSWLMITYIFGVAVGWRAPAEALPRMRGWVDHAIAVDPNHGYALTGDGIYKFMSGDLKGASESFDRAVAVEPNLDDAWFYRGYNLMLLGQADAAVESLERAMRLSPIPSSIRFGVLGSALRNAGRLEEAVATLVECLRRFPDFVYAHTSLAVVYGMMGNQEAAEQEVAETLKVDPTYTVERFVKPNLYVDPTIMARSAGVLKRAGLPEK